MIKLKNSKISITNPRISFLVQRELFRFGCRWNGTGGVYFDPGMSKYTIYIDENLIMTFNGEADFRAKVIKPFHIVKQLNTLLAKEILGERI